MTDRAELRRLILQLERDLSARAQVRSMLTVFETTVAVRRRDVRNLKARIGRRLHEARRTT
jgi:capsid portal protein